MSMPMQNKQKAINEQPLILTYYPIRGVLQPIRILCHYLQIPFADNYIGNSQENQIEPGFRLGFPILEDGDFKVHQQIAILNYVCMKAEKSFLLGLTPQHGAKINEFLFKYSIQKKKIMSNIIDGLKFVEDPNMTNKQICDKTVKKIIQQSRFMQNCLKHFSKNKKHIFQTLSVIDFLFYEMCFYIEGFYKELIPKQSQFYGIIRFKTLFEKQDFLKHNRTKIDQYPLFFEFSSASLNKLVNKLWKGINHQNLFVKQSSKNSMQQSN